MWMFIVEDLQGFSAARSANNNNYTLEERLVPVRPALFTFDAARLPEL